MVSRRISLERRAGVMVWEKKMRLEQGHLLNVDGCKHSGRVAVFILLPSGGLEKKNSSCFIVCNEVEEQ